LLSIIFLIGFPAALLCTFIFKEWFIKFITNQFPKMLPFQDCLLYSRYGFYCPYCGGTRSVLSLLRGDIISSLRYNIIPSFLFILVIGFYVESAARIFGKKLIIVPRRLSFVVVVIAFFVVYFVLRNYIKTF